ncbi:hypothetical protein B0H10DRAFT_1810299 [Mycena sp. CBHHK59/15]|nr:hypothetical protein B0H10DRAFT_1810299 [Mycena sp. CBHHK59/15]
MAGASDDLEGWEDEVRAGIFSRHVRWCCCVGEDGLPLAPDIQLIDSHFYPATSDKPSTAFTFNVLDEFAIDALECKTAEITAPDRSCFSLVHRGMFLAVYIHN